MAQIARNVRGQDGFLAGKKHLIHNRDSLYEEECLDHLIPSSEEPLHYGMKSSALSVRADCFDHTVAKPWDTPSCCAIPVQVVHAQMRSGHQKGPTQAVFTDG
jgi:hypothetical protein